MTPLFERDTRPVSFFAAFELHAMQADAFLPPR